MSIFTSVKNMFIEVTQQVGDSLEDPTRDIPIAIEQAKLIIKQNEEQLVVLEGEQLILQDKILELEKSLKKWAAFIKEADAAGRKDDVDIFYKKHKDDSAELDNVRKTFEENANAIESCNGTISNAIDRINTAEMRLNQLLAKSRQNKLHKSISKAQVGLENHDPFAALDDFEKKIDKESREIEARIKIANERKSADILAKEYETKVDDEAALAAILSS